jgi:hypothetical protein
MMRVQQQQGPFPVLLCMLAGPHTSGYGLYRHPPSVAAHVSASTHHQWHRCCLLPDSVLCLFLPHPPTQLPVHALPPPPPPLPSVLPAGRHEDALGPAQPGTGQPHTGREEGEAAGEGQPPNQSSSSSSSSCGQEPRACTAASSSSSGRSLISSSTCSSTTISCYRKPSPSTGTCSASSNNSSTSSSWFRDRCPPPLPSSPTAAVLHPPTPQQ